MVPDEFRDQFRRDFEEDDFFRDPVAGGAGRSSVGSSRGSVPAAVQAPAPDAPAPPAPQAPAAAPRRPGFFRRLASGIGSGLSRVARGVSNAFSGLFGRGQRAAPAPNAAAAPRTEPAFDYEDAAMERMMPGLERRRQQVDVSRLNPMVPGLAPDTKIAPEYDPYDIWAVAEREQAAAVAAMQAHMAKQAMRPKVEKGSAAARSHGSAQTDLDAAFDGMQSEDDAEDLLGAPGHQAIAPVPPPGPGASIAPVRKEQSRESFLREGDAMWNNMRDDDADDANGSPAHQVPGMVPSQAEAPFDDRRLSIDVEQEGGLEEDLQNVPPDMRDFPGAEILYEPQRVRMKHVTDGR